MFAYKTKEGQRLNKLASSNPRKFWKIIKNSINKKEEKSNSLNAYDLFNHFKDMYQNENQENEQPESNNDATNNDQILDMEISENEIIKAVLSQNNNKSPGIDQLPAELFKCSIHIILPFLKALFNRIFLKHEYPESWGKGIITPVFKKGDVNDAKTIEVSL